MTHHKAKKIVIITEKLITKGVAEIIEECGATGYTIFRAGGVGAHGKKSADRANVIDGLSNVKIEVITTDEAQANQIADKVAEKYFEDYSGITYLENVEILRKTKFSK